MNGHCARLKRVFLTGVLLGLAGGPPAVAQTILNLSATGLNTVAPDEITASLSVQASSAEAAVAQAKVNAMMKEALAQAKAVSGVVATTDSYNVYQNTPNGATEPVYQASQSLNLVMPAKGGVPPDAFTRLVGALQGHGLLLNSLDGDLSAAGQNAAQQGAIADAIRQIKAQAAAIAEQLGDEMGPIKTLNVNSNTPGPMPRATGMMMAMAAPSTPPQAAPGNVSVTADVNASIALMEKP
jgi:uncharacterized protein YggE